MKKNLLLLSFLIFTSTANAATTKKPALEKKINYESVAEQYLKQKKYDLAIENYLKALKDTPKNSSIKYLIGKIYYEKKDYNKAIQYLNEFSGLQPNKKEYMDQLIAKIKDQSIRPASPPILKAEVTFIEPSKTGMLNALDTGYLIINIKNEGKDPAKNLNIKISTQDSFEGLDFKKSFTIAKLEANNTNEIKIPLKAAEDIKDQDISLKLEVIEPYYRADADPYLISLKTRALRPPELTISDFAVEDNSENILLKNNYSTISAIVTNKGAGSAENVTGSIRSLSEGITILDNSDFSLETIPSNGSKKISFKVFTGKGYKLSSTDFNIFMKNKLSKFNKTEKITLKVEQKDNTIAVNTITNEAIPVNQTTLVPSLKVDVDTEIPKTGIENKYGVAVIIGNQKYQNKDIPSVEFASNDARVFKTYVKNVLGYKEDNIIYLENATYTDFLKTFGNKDGNGKVSDYIKEGKSDVIVYYSGHGAPDTNEGEKKSAYLVPVDAEASQLKTVGYPLETFYNNLNNLKARSVTVILDSCFSGGSGSSVGNGMIIKAASPIFIKTTDLDIGKINVLASSSGDQISSWYPEKKHSLFTYYLLKALKYGAKPDNEDNDIPSRDGKFNLEDLQIYINDRVSYMARKLYSRKQSVVLKANSEKNLVK